MTSLAQASVFTPGAANRTPTGSTPTGTFSATAAGANLGVQGFYGLSDLPLTEDLTATVNVATGNLVLRSQDLTINGPGQAVALNRFVNSRGAGAGSFGSRATLDTGRDVGLSSGANGSLVLSAASGFTATFTPSGNGRFTPPAGLKADLSTLSDGRRTLVFRGTGRAQTFTAGGFLVADTDRNGVGQSLRYNGDGTLASITDGAGRVTAFAYAGGRISRVTDPAGRTIDYAYTGADLSSVTDPGGGVTSYTYASGRLVTVTTPGGSVVRFGYDGSGRVLSLDRYTARNASSGDAATTTFSYTGGTTAFAAQAVQTDPLGHATTYALDSSGRVTGTTDPLGRARSSTYTAGNDVATSTDAMGVGMVAGNVTSRTYDARGNATSTVLPTGAITQAAYVGGAGCASGDTGNPDLAKCATDPQGNQSSLAYDAAGNLTRTADSTTGGTGAVQLTLTRQGASGVDCGAKTGQVCTSTDGRGNATSYGYDNDGNQTRITRPAPLGAVTVAYDSLGRATGVTDGNGGLTSYGYDRLDRLVLTTAPAGSTVTSAYDRDGNRVQQADNATGAGTTTYVFDALDRQTAVRPPNATVDLTVTLDKAGNTLTSSDPGGTTTYGYDNANALVSLAEPSDTCPTSGSPDGCTRFGYDRNGAKVTTTYPGGTVETTTRDGAGRATRIRAVNAAGSVLSDLSYSYTAAGHTGPGADRTVVQSRTDAVGVGAPAGSTQSFGYDSLGRLTSEVEKTTAGTTNTTLGWSYDAAGNRLSFAYQGAGITTGTDTRTYNPANQVVTRNGQAAGIGYDNNGNQTAAPGLTDFGVPARTATYNDRDQVTNLTSPASREDYTYTGPGNATLLSGTQEGGVQFQNSLTGLSATVARSQRYSYLRTPGGELVAQRAPYNGTRYYLTDNLGSVIGQVDAIGRKIAAYSYDPFGITRTATGPAAADNPFRFIGGLQAPGSGLVKLGIRWYDPTDGRFTQLDPTGQDTDYTYAASNPTTFSDPTGASCGDKISQSTTIGGGGGAVVGFFAGAFGGGGIGAGPGAGIGAGVGAGGGFLYGVGRCLFSLF